MKPSDHPAPTVFAIFGGAGDLTRRKLIPALFDLFRDRALPSHFSIIGVDRVDLNDEQLRRRLRDGVSQFAYRGKVDGEVWDEFARHIFYQQGDFKKPETYSRLGERCANLDQGWNLKAQRVFCMATPPAMFAVRRRRDRTSGRLLRSRRRPSRHGAEPLDATAVSCRNGTHGFI